MKNNKRVIRWFRGELSGTIERGPNGSEKLVLDEISQGILAKENNRRLILDREIARLMGERYASDSSRG